MFRKKIPYFIVIQYYDRACHKNSTSGVNELIRLRLVIQQIPMVKIYESLFSELTNKHDRTQYTVGLCEAILYRAMTT